MTDLIKIQQELEPELKEYEEKFSNLNPITNKTDHLLYQTGLKEIQTKSREIESKRKQLTKPLLDAKKGIDTFFNAAISRLTAAGMNIKTLILMYEQKLEQERKELQAKQVEKAIETGDMSLIVAPDAQNERVQGIKKRTVWKYEVLDKTLVPIEYLCPDEEKIGAIARATKGTLYITGIRIYGEEILVA